MLPLIPAILLGVSAVALASLTPFWEDIVTFAKKVLAKLQPLFQEEIEGFLVYLRKEAQGLVKKVQKNYMKNEAGKYMERIVTENVFLDDVEEKFKAQLRNQDEIDISEELQLELAKVS